MFCHTPYRVQVSSNIGDVPHIFQVARAPLALYQHLNINMTRPTSQYCSFICQWYFNESQKPIIRCNVLLVCSRGVIHQNYMPTYPQVSCYSLSLPKMLKLWYRPLKMSPCYLLSLIYSCQLSVHWQFMFRWPMFPQWKQLQFSLVSSVDFFNPLGLLDVVLIARFRDFVVDACATNALDFPAVIDVCNRFSIAHSFSSRLFFVHLSSSNSQILLTFWYSGPVLPRSAYAAVQSVCHATLIDAALYSYLRIASQL